MSSRQIKQAVSELASILTGRKFLNRAGLTAKKVRSLISGNYIENFISDVWPVKRRFTCAEVLNMCLPIMNELVEDSFIRQKGENTGKEDSRTEVRGTELTPKEGWLSFIYQYACHIVYPDNEFSEQNSVYHSAVLFYLTVLQFFLDAEREALPYDHFVDFDFLTEDEAKVCESYEEYRTFRKEWHDQFIYEMMRINMEATSFKTLEHIAGVHFVAMHCARGLKAAGVPVDLTLVSGAAAGHDLGKFGCKPGEAVPYMHYYYTNVWFDKFRMPYIGHIAANHSTWDLEPEALSVEALLLIYADFRVKQHREGNETVTHISTLKEAFDVILAKLQNMTPEKLERYRFVYSRLHDFGEYMQYLGVDTDLDGETPLPERMPEITLRNVQDTIRSLVFMGVEHNIIVMHRMSAERQFGIFLESARSIKKWKNLRVYLSIFNQYTAYTNDEQKKQTLAFLYELLMHQEGEIRAEAATLIGKILAQFNFGYRKRFPSGMADLNTMQAVALSREYFLKILEPDLKLTHVQKYRIRYNLKNVLIGILQNAVEEDREILLGTFLELFKDPGRWKPAAQFVILNAVFDLPLAEMSREALNDVGQFAEAVAVSADVEAAIAAWRAEKVITSYTTDLPVCEQIGARVEAFDPKGNITLTFLKYRILQNLGKDTTEEEKIICGPDVISDIFLDNLKAATPWIIKAVNIKLLKHCSMLIKKEHHLHIAAHLSNLIKVSEHMVIRRDAADALLELVPFLTSDERNEIAVELMRALELGDAQYSRHLPRCLGMTALWLPPEQMKELVSYLGRILSSGSDSVASGVLDTIGIILEHYSEYGIHFSVSDETMKADKQQLLGMILRGMAAYQPMTKREAMLVLGNIFASKDMTADDKYALFEIGYRKILYLLNEGQMSLIGMFYRAFAVSALSTYIVRLRMDKGDVTIPEREKVAFFPGTFDPFTKSHKEIVREIRDKGFELYLAVDEFSWSKKAQPHMVRRKILNMSVADEFHVNVFPLDIPINIGNSADLRTLKDIFAGRKVYMVVGSDVVGNASFYKNDPEPDSIHSMNHLIFRRVGNDRLDSHRNREMLKCITGKIFELELPPEFEDVSSTVIRDNVDMNRDISNLIDPMAQGYIYSSGMYLREPEYKPLVSGKILSFEKLEEFTEEWSAECRKTVFAYYENKNELIESIRNSGEQVMLLRNSLKNDSLVGMITYRIMQSGDLLDVLKHVALADQVRRRTTGSILLISGIYSCHDEHIRDPEQLLLSEVIVNSFRYGCTFGMFLPGLMKPSTAALDAVKRQGFMPQEKLHGGVQMWLVDMHEPLVILRNLGTTIKAPMNSDRHVLRILDKTHHDLQMSMTGLYPGQLVLSLSSAAIYPRLMEMVTKLNGVPNVQLVPRQLGPCMCVPYGKILRDRIIPNTVTKTLHTDKVFSPDLQESWIEAFPNYTPLEKQIRMIHSFDRPVILVDDIMNSAGRFEALEPMLRRENVKIRQVVLGVLTGLGKDTLTQKNVDVDSVYYIPNIRRWYVESSLYPFIGGDTVKREMAKVAGLSPSINQIFPYMNPRLPGAERDAMFAFSATCIRNARDLFLVLEETYRAHFGRNLTLERLSEAVIAPLCPDHGECMGYDPTLPASVYLDNDLLMLTRDQYTKPW